jgi:hypothetical protein
MFLDVDVRVLQVVSAWCLSRHQHLKKMKLTTAFESENVVDGNVYAYTLMITKYWLDGSQKVRTRSRKSVVRFKPQCRAFSAIDDDTIL